MTDELLPIPASWDLADPERDRHHPLVQAAAAVRQITGAPVEAFTRESQGSTLVALVVRPNKVEHVTIAEVMNSPELLVKFGEMFAHPLRQVADELVAVAAALNSEAHRLDRLDRYGNVAILHPRHQETP